jgi:ribosome-associated translation inhibitor RaiA
MFQPDPQIHMRTDVQARGFALTAALRCAVEHEAQEYAERFPEVPTGIQVRLFDVNGRRGGLDKGCLVAARVGCGRIVVATDLDSDLYRAIPAAFAKLDRGTRSILGRRQACRRAQR